MAAPFSEYLTWAALLAERKDYIMSMPPMPPPPGI